VIDLERAGFGPLFFYQVPNTAAPLRALPKVPAGWTSFGRYGLLGEPKTTIPGGNALKTIGYDRPLFVQPFDHRGSFTKGFFGIKGQPEISTAHDQHSPVADAKTLVYRGLLHAIALGVPSEQVGILIDTQFGGHIIADAKAKDIPVSVCVEKSGQDIFDFEYGDRWQDHLRFIQPAIVKVLVRHHPHVDLGGRREQMARLKQVSDYIHAHDDTYYMFELLVPATTDEDKAFGARYDVERRPGLMIEAIRELQDFGIEPDIWKIEGLERAEDAIAVAAQTRNAPHRQNVGNILLGRGSDKESVHRWLRVAAPLAGYCGFAVGRTNFSAPLVTYIADPNPETAATAIRQIGENFKGCVDVWKAAAGG
jgi:myo-inositol catabolism protein IolC